MKKQRKLSLVVLFNLLVVIPSISVAQNKKAFIHKYLDKISISDVDNREQKYKMTAIYTNRDLYGKFIDKTEVIGEYTRGLGDGNVAWKNVYISNSKGYTEPFESKIKQEYMENIKYKPSPKMLDPENYKNFPPTPAAVFSRNLIWDTMAIESFAWDHLDTLELNKTYRIPGEVNKFDMADIGTYQHAEILMCWTGISAIDNELYAVIEYEALDNIVNVSLETLTTKGTEQYWGTILVSLETREIGQAVMYSGSAQEIEIAGMDTKFMVKTIRELRLDKI